MSWLTQAIERFAAEVSWPTSSVQAAKRAATIGDTRLAASRIEMQAESKPPLHAEERAELLTFLIEHITSFGPLDDGKRHELRTFKSRLGAEEREPYSLRRWQVAEIVQTSMRADLFDGRVDQVESRRRVDLQELLEISYDEYLELADPVVQTFVNDRIQEALASGRGPKAKEELEAKLKSLDIALILTPEQSMALATVGG